jgi:hypothetical protein
MEINMKKFLPLLLLLSACGPTGQSGPTGPAGPQGDPAPTPISLEGYYVLPNGGYADVYQDAQGLVTIRALRLVMANADSSFGLIPIASTTAAATFSGRLYTNVSVAYVALTHNVKQDSNAALLAASYLTELIVSKSGNTLTIRAIVNNSSSVIFDHSVSSQ